MRLAAWAAVLLGGCATAPPPGPVGPPGVRGTVVDVCSGAPVRGARVFASSGPGAVRSVATDDAGVYLLAELPEGEYAVGVERGEVLMVRDEVRVRAGRSVRINFQVGPGPGPDPGCLPLERPPPPP